MENLLADLDDIALVTLRNTRKPPICYSRDEDSVKAIV
jgi:hypothetical protein